MKLVDDSDLTENLLLIIGKCLILRATIKKEKYNLVFDKKILKHIIRDSSYLPKY